MPFNELQRRDSWPPTVIRLHSPEDPDDTEAIDQDPFSFFLTSPEDIDEFLDGDLELDLSAGIETPESESEEPVRELSPSSLQRALLDDESDKEGDEDVGFGLAMPLSLKDFTQRISHSGSEGRKSRRGQHTGLGIAIPETQASARGRAKVRLAPSRSGRGRGQTRSLSVRKQSWRVPSPGIYSIREEGESDDEKRDVKGMGQARVDGAKSAPATTRLEQLVIQVPDKHKIVKRVHWAANLRTRYDDLA
ncbi:hypothetical protein PZA11_001487 [Diplocarpon coronariae]|uniref:Uncharacterized protein n=1 Tax=Diplocarpon coronariae TaxID=2795749 RepID=A0A218Z0F3_9HELO|nr:hypothetical protein JHW43_000555 [Diplocarpon mali]OWP01013.1 hypothetical protein B2J93_309 [Marssonina coronariae]